MKESAKDAADVSLKSVEVEGEIQTDVCIYEPVDGSEKRQLIRRQEECSVCLMKFKSTAEKEHLVIVKSKIDMFLKDGVLDNRQDRVGSLTNSSPKATVTKLFNTVDIVEPEMSVLELSNSISSDSSTDA